MKRHMILMDYLPDGKYRTCSKPNWHEWLRLRLARRLFESVPKSHILEIKMTTGTVHEVDED